MIRHSMTNTSNMNKEEAARLWNDNAEAWTVLARAGYDLYRDHLNTPGFFQILPEINGLYGLDIGCGEGYNTRLLAAKGADMDAIDVSEIFIQKAQEEEKAHPAGIRYQVADAQQLPFEAGQFDFATAFMSLMDVPEPETAIQEAFRVLKPGGFLQFSISLLQHAAPPQFAQCPRRDLRHRSRRLLSKCKRRMGRGVDFRRCAGGVERSISQVQSPPLHPNPESMDELPASCRFYH